MIHLGTSSRGRTRQQKKTEKEKELVVVGRGTCFVVFHLNYERHPIEIAVTNLKYMRVYKDLLTLTKKTEGPSDDVRCEQIYLNRKWKK